MCSNASEGTATGTLLIENDRVKVWEWAFDGPGDNTGWHRHAHDYVVVPLFDGELEIDLPSGERIRAPMQNGVPYFRETGVEHDVISANDSEYAFVEIEFK